MSLSTDQVALLAAVAHRERTPAELAAAIGGTAHEMERRLRVLRRLEVVKAHVDICPLCQHVSGRRVYRATEQGVVALSESPLMRGAAIA